MDEWVANQSQFAALLDVTPQRVGHMRKQGLPSLTNHGRVEIPLGPAIRWLIDRERAQATDRKTNSPRYRKDLVDAELAELTLARERGEMVTVAEVRDRMGRMGDRVRAAMTALPGKWAAKVNREKRVGDVRRVLRKAIGEVLEELSNP